MKGLRADLLQAFRHYATTPVSSAMAVVVLAAAMAALTAFLALFNDLAIESHPGLDAGGMLVTVAETDGRRMYALSYTLVERIDEDAATIESIAGTTAISMEVEHDDGERQQIGAELVTERYFPALRPRMQLGRPFDAADHAPGAEPVVILSDSFWRERLGARPDALGETVRVHPPSFALRTRGGSANPRERVRDYRIVGVMAPEMPGALFPNITLWMPYEATVDYLFAEIGGLETTARGGGMRVAGIALAAEGASVRAIRTELEERFADDLEIESGLSFPGRRLEATRGVVRDFHRHRDALAQVRLFLGGSVLLALVASCNVSLFLLSRAPGRRRELSIRMAVGAPSRRLARQLVTEAGLLVAAAAVLGVLLSVWVTVLVKDLAFFNQAQWRDATPFDWRVLAMVTGFALVVTALVSLAPVLGLARLGIAAGSRSVKARASWAQRIAGTLQLSIAAVIGAAALAFVWYLAELAAMDRGFAARDVQLVALFPGTPPDYSLPPEVHLQEREHRRAVIGSLPGVEEVAFGTSAPGLFRQVWILPSAPPDAPEDSFVVNIQSADPGYLRMLDVNLLDGRFLDDGDRDRIVINETLARRLWDRVDVAGEILPLALGPNGPRWEVVGVIEDIAYGHPAQSAEPMAFNGAAPAAALDWALVRTTRRAEEIRDALQRKIDDGELDVRVTMIRSVEELWGEQLAPDRARAWLTVASALLVAVLAGFGYYGTQHFLVAAGRREYAILGAVGAGPRALGRLVLARGLKLGAPGIVLGGLLAFVTAAWLRGDFVSNSVSPPAVAVVVLAALSVLLLVAGIGPARAARRTDPGPLLKQE